MPEPVALLTDPATPASSETARPRSSLPVMSRALAGDDWDHVVSGFDTICQEQLYAFAGTRWPGVSLEPRLFEQDGAVIGGALVMIQKLPLGLAKIAIVKWGPMLARSGVPDASAHYLGMVEALIAEFAEQRGMLLSILPHASVTARNLDYVALRHRGFQRGAILGYPDRYLVNLRLADEAQRRSFEQTWRRQLGKAEKANLTFEHAGPDQLDAFKRLYEAMTSRKQFRDYSAYETLDRLMELERPVRPELFLVGQGEAIVAGALVFAAGNRAVYLYGATSDAALPLRAGYFLHWHIIRWLRDNSSAKWYDLGGTDGYSGLHQFKKGMVGSEGVVRPIPPVANYATRPSAFVLGTGALWARELFNTMRRKIDVRRGDGAKPDQAPYKLEDDLR